MSCSIPGCKVGYLSSREERKLKRLKNKSLFYVPKNNEQLREEWKNAIQTHTGKIIESNSRVCEDHFLNDEIIRFDEVVTSDGVIHRIERKRMTLKVGAVPSIFTHIPSHPSPETNGSTGPEFQANVVLEKNMINSIEQTSEQSKMPSECKDVAKHSDGEDSLTFDQLCTDINNVHMPNSMWTGTFLSAAKEVVFVKWNPVNYTINKKLIVTESLTVKIILYDEQTNVDCIASHLSSFRDLVEALRILDELQLCPGVQLKGVATRSEFCSSHIARQKLGEVSHPRTRCNHCQRERKKHCDKLRKKVPDLWKKRHERTKGVVKCVKNKNIRLQRKVLNLKAEVEAARRKCGTATEDAIQTVIASLPVAQQESVRACLAAAKVKGSSGRRYTTSWVYECLLLRIKSRKLYEHLRSHEILVLPCADTLNKYIRRMNGCYGFQQATLDLMKKKSALLKPEERRGTLLVDEMKLTEKLCFNRRTLTVNGFVDLGNHTPVHQKSQKGDHALVMLFQPFRGSWTQSVAAFLSRGCATSKVLHHLVMECIILLEKAGFHVDIVTTDGATWNRSMWKLFGITEENNSCEHVYDHSRKLWFCSDFPHLIKTLRNFVTKTCTTWTPDGDVHLKHWDAVLAKDNPLGFNLKVCPKLSASDVRPKGYQKMSVARAYRFFGRQTAVGMQVYQADHEDLVDCAPSVNLINRVDNLIAAMSSRTPADALRNNSDAMTYIQSFLEFLEKWETGAKEQDFLFMPQSTCYGLKITLRATIELLNYLTTNYDYEYLMTARLNQDALERFFGMMRGACGSNDHPDSNVFAQLFRLISTYSLVKPPKGSNVTGGEMLTTLLQTKDITDDDERSAKFQAQLDVMIDNGVASEDIAVAVAAASDHDYNIARSSDFLTSFISGYVARRSARFTQCHDCLEALKCQHSLPRDKMIDIASKGFLLRPSELLFQLVSLMETAVLKVVSEGELNTNTLFSIGEEIENQDNIPLVGCLLHRDGLTEAIIRFYLVTRMHFLCNMANKIDGAKSEKSKQHRKSAKLM